GGGGGGGGGGRGEEGRRRRAKPRSQIIFVGTGSSTAVPSAFHLLHPEQDDRKSVLAQLAVATPPEANKNYRYCSTRQHLLVRIWELIMSASHNGRTKIKNKIWLAKIVYYTPGRFCVYRGSYLLVFTMVPRTKGNTSVVVRVVKDKRDGFKRGGDSASERGGGAGGGGGSDLSSEEGKGGQAEGRGGGRGGGGVQVKHVQIDTGKTWREGIIRWFPRHKVKSIDGIVLTHDHADAMLGLDDVRGLQVRNKEAPPMPVHVSEKTDRAVKRVFPYLVGRESDNGAGGRFVASLTFNVFQDFQPFEVRRSRG
ncbi:unnamed protein product, partial [Laminaria digitata]